MMSNNTRRQGIETVFGGLCQILEQTRLKIDFQLIAPVGKLIHPKAFGKDGHAGNSTPCNPAYTVVARESEILAASNQE